MRNAGSRTPIGILRSEPGDTFSSPDFDAASAVSAEAVRGAATAAANRLVVARKSLRLRELGTDVRSMECPLAVRFCCSETLCRASIIRIRRSHETQQTLLAKGLPERSALDRVVDNNACFPTCSCAR